MNKQFNFNFAPSKLSDINKKNETVFFLKEVKVIKKTIVSIINKLFLIN